jgi:hypothetical protein
MIDNEGNMDFSFTIPNGLLGRFGVIKLWPEIQVAEDEIIARLINTASLLGLECIVLDHAGRSLRDKGRPMTGKDLDFVIHLHFSTPKSYDIFSFATLWNPTQFLHDFGYRPMVENLLTHDDYLSCKSPGADLHLRRLMHRDPFGVSPKFNLFHSLATPVLPPTLGALKIFYMGINWERLSAKRSRHQTVLNLLDSTALLRIYGPEELQGVKVWDGFESYQRSLPFDGVSIIHEIHRAGICLALSSQPHKDAALMSSRLFEGLAAGALIICDENPWARTHFGDTLLSVDLRNGGEAVAERIIELVDWARQNWEAALALATRAQNIFKQRFTMDASIADIYLGLQARKDELAQLYRAKIGDASVRVIFLAPDVDDEAFGRQVAAAQAESVQGFQSIVLVDHYDVEAARAKLARQDAAVEVRGADFCQRNTSGAVLAKNGLGVVLKQQFQAAAAGTFLCFVKPSEAPFTNHVGTLAAALGTHPDADYAWSKTINLTTDDKGESHYAVEPNLDLLSRDWAAPIGLGRFMFRAGAFDDAVDYLLESLDIRVASGLALYATGHPTGHATLIVDSRADRLAGADADAETRRARNSDLWTELEAIRDLDAARFDMLDADKLLRDQIHEIGVRIGGGQPSVLAPFAFSLDRLSQGNKRWILLQLLASTVGPGLTLRVWRNCTRLLGWTKQRPRKARN